MSSSPSRRACATIAIIALVGSVQVSGTPARGAPAESTFCPGPDPAFVTDRQVRQAPALAEPRAREPFRDPVFGTCLVRVTDRNLDIAPGDISRGIKNEYSRVQAFNADESLILARGLAATWYLYDAATLQPLGKLAFDGSVDPRWDATEASTLYFIDGTRLFTYHVRTHEQRLLRDFASDFPGQQLSFVWGRSEGSPSIEGRYWGLMAEDAEEYKPVAFLVYDRPANSILARRDLRGVPGIEEDVDYVTISPLGTYFVAAFDRICETGSLGTDARPCGLMVYDRDLTHGRGLGRNVGHHDLMLDAGGREVMVYQDNDTDQIAVADLASGRVTPLWPIDFSHESIGLHFSGQAHRRPGWALVSTHDASIGSRTWMDDQVFAIELKPGGRVARLAHTHALVNPDLEHDYWAEPHATVNRDFTRVLFTSNWGRSGTDEVETFLIDLPAGWLDQLP